MRTYGVTARGYGAAQPVSGYYDDGENLFYFDERDRSLLLVAAPGGGQRVVFKQDHRLHGPLSALLFTGGSSPQSEDVGFDWLKRSVPTLARTTGMPEPASSLAWLSSLDLSYKSRKPWIRRPEIWAVIGFGAFGVGYFVYSRATKKV